MCTERLNKIDMLIEMLPSYNEGFSMGDNIKNLRVEDGKAMATNLFRPPDNTIAVAHTKAWPETKFLKHYHPEVETIIVFKGDLTLLIGEKEIILTAGDTVTLEPNTGHSGYTRHGCELIAVTVPASKGFPNNDGKN